MAHMNCLFEFAGAAPWQAFESRLSESSILAQKPLTDIHRTVDKDTDVPPSSSQ
jgi:hypothetical protein